MSYFNVLHSFQDIKQKYPGVPIFAIGHSMGGMIVLRACLNHPTLFRGVVLQGPLIIPGFSIGPLDARVNFYTYVPASLLLGLLDIINPEMVLGGNVLSTVTSDEEMKSMLRKDDLRWTRGVKVGEKSHF
jgi:alpha-beta hydrolase superfamily lysophospholipase